MKLLLESKIFFPATLLGVFFSLKMYILAVHDRLQQQYRARASDGFGENRDFLPEPESSRETAGQFLNISTTTNFKKIFLILVQNSDIRILPAKTVYKRYL